jgi:uncharacterized protein YecT (DUF1311 family)
MKNLLLTAFIFLSLNSFSQTQKDMNDGSQMEYIKANGKLEVMYQEIKQQYSKDKNFIAALEQSAKLFRQFRDVEVKLHYPSDNPKQDYGSINSYCVNQLLTQLTLQRIKELNVWLVGIQEGEACRGSIKLSKN